MICREISKVGGVLATTLILSSLPITLAAQENQRTWKCNSNERCGTLVETSCGLAMHSFLLKFDGSNKFHAVMGGEIWGSTKIDTTFNRDDVTYMTLDAPSGEVALLSISQDWNFALTVHYTGLGDGVHWLSERGTCEELT
jgi:hypothetical protein